MHCIAENLLYQVFFVLFVCIAVSMERNQRHYFQSNLRTGEVGEVSEISL